MPNIKAVENVKNKKKSNKDDEKIIVPEQLKYENIDAPTVQVIGN